MSTDTALTYSQCAAIASRRLAEKFGNREASWMVRIIFEQIKGYNQVEMAIRANDSVSEFTSEEVSKAVDRLLTDEPIQYIFGEAYFYGMKLKVTPDVLIPRPETAELVDLIVDNNRNRQDLRIADIGTGSGCIAIALSRNLPFSNVTGFDINHAAIDIARENASKLNARVDFVLADALSMDCPKDAEFDLIVSNPPYIAESEKSGMEPMVLDHEPHEALFVPDQNPLLFYKAISFWGKCSLKSGGQLYFEINPMFAEQLRHYLENEGWTRVEVRNDSQNRKRFISAISVRI